MNIHPLNFRFYIGGYYGGHNEFIYKDNALICYISDYPMAPPSPTHIVQVHNDSDWEALLALLQNIKWASTYASNIIDGTQWELEFLFNTVKVKSYGSNSYPADFNQFIISLAKILSKHNIAITSYDTHNF